MFKTILLIKKRADLSREEFIDYYERHHLPFMLQLLPGKISTHRRNYILEASDFEYRQKTGSGEWPGDFDVITEAIYKGRNDAEQLTAMCRKADIYRKVVSDEANFIEPGGVKKYIVETRETQISPLW